MSDNMIGHVLRGSTTGFVCGTRINKLEAPEFGAFVEAPCGNGGSRSNGERVIGLIYAIHIDDDPLVRQLILADNITDQTLQDQRVNRMVPVEISIVNVGFFRGKEPRHALPPRPPLSLAEVHKCQSNAVQSFCERLDFFRLVLNAPEVPADELLAAGLLQAADAIGKEKERNEFLVKAGRELARLLSHDLARLENVLNLIRP
jgi:hypothetical protein